MRTFSIAQLGIGMGLMISAASALASIAPAARMVPSADPAKPSPSDAGGLTAPTPSDANGASQPEEGSLDSVLAQPSAPLYVELKLLHKITQEDLDEMSHLSERLTTRARNLGVALDKASPGSFSAADQKEWSDARLRKAHRPEAVDRLQKRFRADLESLRKLNELATRDPSAFKSKLESSLAASRAWNQNRERFKADLLAKTKDMSVQDRDDYMDRKFDEWRAKDTFLPLSLVGRLSGWIQN